MIINGTHSKASIQSARLWGSLLKCPEYKQMYLKICCEFFNFYNIIWLYVIPTPYELVEGILLALLLS